jgi:ubiquinone biosynthesis protein
VRCWLRLAARVWQAITILVRWIVLPALPLSRDRPGRLQRMSVALEQLGSAWIKLGQMLALRLDLLPAAYCDELFKLLNEVKPFPYDDVRPIVHQGAPPEVVFRSFETRPFASASIGQVHCAVLMTGEAVAVKVQRPNIREIMRADIELMYSVAQLLDWTHFFEATNSHQIIDEFASWTTDELDYLIEARRAMLLYEHARGEPRGVHRARLPRLHHLAPAHQRAHRGYPAGEHRDGGRHYGCRPP